ncbi:MAG: hypothetical protein M9916_13270 [Crocinitomicaceae bacterium]|nr:hypothetical protein [Crocinitomicaceae bacterium]
MYYKLILILFLLIFKLDCYAQSFEDKLKDIYNFNYTTISQQNLEKKNLQLAEFWDELNKDTATFLPKIRKELTINTYPSYFYFDMCSYLSIHSTKKADRSIIENALQFIQWSEMNQWEFVDKLRTFSTNGMNVMGAVSNLLNIKKLSITNPATNQRFNQGEVTAYLLLPLSPEKYINQLDKLYDTINLEAQRTIITVLWLSNTQYGNASLENKAKTTSDIDVRSYVNRLMYRFHPSQELIGKYESLNEIERNNLLLKTYYKTIDDWNVESWNNLIQLTKLLHYFSIQVTK